MEGERDLVPPGSEPGRGTPAPRRRPARRQMARARPRPLPDAEHADRTDRAIDGGMRRASRDEHRSDRPASGDGPPPGPSSYRRKNDFTSPAAGQVLVG